MVYDANTSTEIVSGHSPACTTDGSTLTYHGRTLNSGEWHKVRYVFLAKNSGDGYNCTVYIDGVVAATLDVGATEIPRLLIETRYSESSTGRRTDMIFDINNVRIATLSK